MALSVVREPSAPSVSTETRRLAVVLVRPTRYDDDGYPVRHWRGTMLSNTLSCLHGLTHDVAESGTLDPVRIHVEVFDEAVDHVRPHRIARRLRRPGTRVLVALAGVQTNQFPRARDLARLFKAARCDVMIGGFHVSGAAALAPTLPPECRELVDEGITVVLGEVEDRWLGLLRDAAAGRLRGLYDFLRDPPDLGSRPLPRLSPRLQRKFTVRHYGTIDAGRGCPFNCSFCTIISVQGRTMRSRGAPAIIDHVRRHYRLGGRRRVRHYFFTDDNFARNPQWEAILDGLIALRHEEGVAVDFMMQVDVAASRIPRFVEKAAEAGCVQVFIGMESIREDNLRAAGKRQNRVAEYRASIARWHEAGVLCHVGFIIGFPHDTYGRVMDDVRTLSEELLVDQASFFILTPLPGSRDHQAIVQSGVPIDADYNNYDSFHVTMPHPRMPADEWRAAYEDAWRTFYSFDHMREALLRQNPHTYWSMLKCFLWYRAAMLERAHPMVTGFFRRKSRRSRRPGLPLEDPLRFYRRRTVEVARAVVAYTWLVLEIQELWRAARIRSRDYRWLDGARRWTRDLSARLESKMTWGRTHVAPSTGDGARVPPPGGRAAARRVLTARLDALRRAVGQADSGMATWRRPPLARRWSANPVVAAWRLTRDAANTVVFLVAMTFERL